MFFFPHYKQIDQMDCGATCLKIICKYYGKSISINTIRTFCQTTQKGVSLLGISEASEKLGFRSMGASIDLNQLKELELPAILHWDQNHFVVLYKVKDKKYYISDPAKGKSIYSEVEFLNKWRFAKSADIGAVLILTPTPDLFQEVQGDNSQELSWGRIFKYFYKYKYFFIQLILGILLGSALSLIAPLLTQSVVDVGIESKDIGLINIILIAQLMVFLGSIAIGFLRSWITLHISTRVNISIITDLLIKIMKLPMNFFELKTHGDLIQRIADQKRIETFLTINTINTFFSIINMIVFGVLLLFYNIKIFLVFLVSTVFYIAWIIFFMKYRRRLDQKRFNISSDNQTYIVELIQSIRDIKLNNAQIKKRWGWERIQAKLFKYQVQSLSLTQYQSIGSLAINQIKGIIITFIAAKLVIDGEITLGAMMAIQYIVGMTNSPVESILAFMQSYQDAKISLERLNEIYETENEENIDIEYVKELPKDNTIEFKNITFRYYGAGNDPIFKNLNIVFPAGKTTAIVGGSGSGKTTILKLLLRYYNYEEGQILVGGKDLKKLDYTLWRNSCGFVLTDNYLFADTIANNIAIEETFKNNELLNRAINIANLEEYIDNEPYGLETKVGTAGKGISQGQQQRLMIARAVYKDPEYLFLDEATNSLDANNEKIIVDRLNNFCKGKTVIVIAHRLSTVKSADNIIVLDNGEIVEQGTHANLVELQGKYFNLVKNQLELGN